MEAGAPEPLTHAEGDTLWVAYRARDPHLPAWDDPTVLGYLDRRPGDSFGVLRFDGVTEHRIGPPDDERLREHPLWGHGLHYYSFHRTQIDDRAWRWIVTFHDETLEVTATGAWASPLIFASDASDAIKHTRR